MTLPAQLQFTEYLSFRFPIPKHASSQKVEEVAKPVFVCDNCGQVRRSEENWDRHFWCMSAEDAKELGAYRGPGSPLKAFLATREISKDLGLVQQQEYIRKRRK